MIFFMVDSIKRSKVCSCHAKPQFQKPSVFCWCSSALNCVKEFNEKAIDLTRFEEKFLNKEPQCRKNTRWQRVEDEKPIQQQWGKSEKKQPKKKSSRKIWNKKKILRNASLTIIAWFEHVDVLESMKTETENIARLWKIGIGWYVACGENIHMANV